MTKKKQMNERWIVKKSKWDNQNDFKRRNKLWKMSAVGNMSDKRIATKYAMCVEHRNNNCKKANPFATGSDWITRMLSVVSTNGKTNKSQTFENMIAIRWWNDRNIGEPKIHYKFGAGCSTTELIIENRVNKLIVY